MSKVITLAAAVGIAGIGGLVFGAPAWGGEDPSATETCRLYADPVSPVGAELVGHGGRVGCINPRNVTVSVYQHMERWPDQLKAEETAPGVDVHLAPRGGCTDPGEQPGDDVFYPYYTHTASTTGNEVYSPHTRLC